MAGGSDNRETARGGLFRGGARDILRDRVPTPRHLLLLTFLVAALATQRVVAHGTYSTPLLSDLTQTVVGARRLVRKLTRDETRPVRNVLSLGKRLTLRRLRLLVDRLTSAVFTPVPLSPFLFRLPPPALA